MGAPMMPPPPGTYPGYAYLPPPKRATFTTIISGAFSVWAGNIRAFFLVYLVVGAAVALLGAGVSFALLGTLEAGGFLPLLGTPTAPAASIGLFVAYVVGAAIVSVVLTSIVTGGMTEFAIRRFRGESMPLRRAIERGVEKFLSILGATLLLQLIVVGLVTVPAVFLVYSLLVAGALGPGGTLAAVCGSFIAFTVGGIIAIYLYVSMVLYAPIIMMENTRAIEGLSRSWRVTKGYWWSLFGAILVIGILTVIVSAAISAPTFLTDSIVVSIVTSVLGTAIVGPWFAILAAIAYEQITRPPPGYFGPAMPVQAPPSPPPAGP